MDTREKLIELRREAEEIAENFCVSRMECYQCPYDPTKGCQEGVIADHLIANGVTIQKWIPVTERLPELIPCDAGTAYSEAVNVLTSGRKVLTAIWDGTDFIADAEFWEAEGEEITHWTPVLLPLPEPPKGEGL